MNFIVIDKNSYKIDKEKNVYYKSLGEFDNIKGAYTKVVQENDLSLLICKIIDQSKLELYESK